MKTLKIIFLSVLVSCFSMSAGAVKKYKKEDVEFVFKKKKLKALTKEKKILLKTLQSDPDKTQDMTYQEKDRIPHALNTEKFKHIKKDIRRYKKYVSFFYEKDWKNPLESLRSILENEMEDLQTQIKEVKIVNVTEEYTIKAKAQPIDWKNLPQTS